MNIRFVLLAVLLALLPAIGHAQTCPLPTTDKDVAALVEGNAKLAVTPYWNDTASWLVPWDQPVTLHVSSAVKFADAATISVIGKTAGGTWQAFAVRSWQPASTGLTGVVVIEPPDVASNDPNRPRWQWSHLSLVVASCSGSAMSAFGVADAPLSPSCLAGFIALLITAAFYVLGALTLKTSVEQKLSRLNPLWLAIDGSGRASLSQMQIIFFSVIVLFLVSYIFLRTGILANLSDQVLLLLGIAGVGSVGGQLATNNVQRISFDNWAWMKEKDWIGGGGLHVGRPRWSDLFSTNDVFDPYRFQMVSFSFVIGIALLAIGIHGLADFSIPSSLLGVIGLSQATYLGGKITAPTGFGDLDAKLTAVRAAQHDFLQASASIWVQPVPAPSPTPVAPPAPLDLAKAAHPQEYSKFKELVCPAYEMFKTLFKARLPNPNLEPDPTC
jgi:hypothetical protein